MKGNIIREGNLKVWCIDHINRYEELLTYIALKWPSSLHISALLTHQGGVSSDPF